MEANRGLVAELIQLGLEIEGGLDEVPGVPRPLQGGETTRPVDFPRLKKGELAEPEHPEVSGLAESLPELAQAGPESPPDEISIAEDEVRDTGLFDVCAWYQPIHFYGPDWGIFIREQCVVSLAWRIARFLDPSAVTSAYPPNLAKELIIGSTFTFFLHEHFHHKVEAFGIRLWVVEGAKRYVRYKKGVYRPTLYTDNNLEEALANADSRRRFSHSPYNELSPSVRSAIRDALEWVFAISPGGYRKAEDYFGADFRPGTWNLQAQIQEARLRPKHDETRWKLATHSLRSLRKVDDRIWAVLPRGRRPLLP